MCQSEHINELAAALAKAQGEISPAKKDSANPFFKSKYADMNSIWAACKGPLSANGLSIMQTMDYKDGQLILITILAHASGQWVKSYMPIVTEKNNAHGIGAAVTYMRRYSLSAIIGMTCDEEDDGNASVILPQKGKNVQEVEVPYVELGIPPGIDKERLDVFIDQTAISNKKSVAQVRYAASQNMKGFMDKFREWESKYYAA